MSIRSAGVLGAKIPAWSRAVLAPWERVAMPTEETEDAEVFADAGLLAPGRAASPMLVPEPAASILPDMVCAALAASPAVLSMVWTDAIVCDKACAAISGVTLAAGIGVCGLVGCCAAPLGAPLLSGRLTAELALSDEARRVDPLVVSAGTGCVQDRASPTPADSGLVGTELVASSDAGTCELCTAEARPGVARLAGAMDAPPASLATGTGRGDRGNAAAGIADIVDASMEVVAAVDDAFEGVGITLAVLAGSAEVVAAVDDAVEGVDIILAILAGSAEISAAAIREGGLPCALAAGKLPTGKEFSGDEE